MDPLSAVSALASCLQVTSKAASVIRDIQTLCEKFKDAEHSIQLLIVQVLSIRTASTQILSWLEATSKTRANGANDELLTQLGTSLDACDSQRTLMDCGESQRIFSQARVDAISLLEPEGCSIRRSATTSTVEGHRMSFSERFEFDREVFSTRVYQRSFTSLMRQSNREASGKEAHPAVPQQHNQDGETGLTLLSDGRAQVPPSQLVERHSEDSQS